MSRRRCDRAPAAAAAAAGCHFRSKSSYRSAAGWAPAIRRRRRSHWDGKGSPAHRPNSCRGAEQDAVDMHVPDLPAVVSAQQVDAILAPAPACIRFVTGPRERFNAGGIVIGLRGLAVVSDDDDRCRRRVYMHLAPMDGEPVLVVRLFLLRHQHCLHRVRPHVGARSDFPAPATHSAAPCRRQYSCAPRSPRPAVPESGAAGTSAGTGPVIPAPRRETRPWPAAGDVPLRREFEHRELHIAHR
jgi:hypothetical protein